MNDPLQYIPSKINDGHWLTAYTLPQLQSRVPEVQVVLPICSLGTPVEELEQLGPLVLPPLYHEGLHPSFKSELISRVHRCFPYLRGTEQRATYDGLRNTWDDDFGIKVVELPEKQYPAPRQNGIVAFSVDTAVEEHGPHLPLCTDTIQSYGVLQRLAETHDELTIAPPVEYGHLTWGLPFGMSVDITPELVTKYVREYTNAIQTRYDAEAIYVVDVHGSIVHRNAIQAGLAESDADRYLFRWLHDPLVEFSGNRGDQHAGGVETALVELINPDLVDSSWWPVRLVELANDQMDMKAALEQQSYLDGFINYVVSRQMNGIVGEIRNYFDVDAQHMMKLMLDTASEDINELLGGSVFVG